MKKPEKSLKNTCKNFGLLALTALLVLLTLLLWMNGLERTNAAPGMILSGFRDRLPFGDGGYVQHTGESPAAYPIRMAMITRDGLLAGAAYNEAGIRAIYDAASPALGAAISEAGVFSETQEEELAHALAGETLMAEYSGGLPLSLLASWLGGTSNQATLAAETLVLTRDGSLFVRTAQDGTLYKAHTNVDETAWQAVQDTAASGYTYAGLDAGLAPETLLSADETAFDVLGVELPAFGDPTGSDSMQMLLGAFAYSAYVKSYLEDDGSTQVFVENYSALRVGQDGIVRFKATSLSGGLSAYPDQDREKAEALAAQVDFAQKLLTKALSAIGSTATTSLQSVSIATGGDACTLRFAQSVGGIPVRMADGQSFAQFEFQGGVLVAAEIKLRSYTQTGEKLYVVPAEQAAATSGNGWARYLIAYLDDGSGRLLPSAYLQG